MPIAERFNTRQGASISTWKLTETEAELSSMMADLGIEDTDSELRQIKVELKRRQWMAARLLLKEMVPTFEGITYDQFGAPYITNHDLNVSLSHSNGHVACILHDNHVVGIDVQKEDAKLKRIATKFLNEEEMARYEKNEKSLPYLHLLWSAKEAVFKIHRHHMAFKKIKTEEFDLLEKGRIKINAERFDGLHKHSVEFKKGEGFYLAYSCYDPDK